MQRKSPPRIDTRSELIEAAWALFAAHGYDGTAVQHIIDAAGVSKGTFYHHFESKEGLLDAVVERMTRAFLDEARSAVDEPALGAIERLNLLLARGRQWRLAHLDLVRETARVLMRDENAIVRHKIHRRTARLVGPVLAGIVAQGANEGIFDCANPEEVAALILDVGHVLGERNAEDLLRAGGGGSPDAVRRRLDIAVTAIERVLGAPAGSIERVEDEFLAAVASVFRPAEAKVRTAPATEVGPVR